MTQDLVQIGPWLVSKYFLDAFFPLLGVLVGGLITYLTTLTIEKRQWEQKNKEERNKQKQKAIEMAMKWIDPIYNASTKAQLLVTSYKQGHTTLDDFQKEYPDILSILSGNDLPRHLIVFLSWDLYRRGRKIADDFNALYVRALSEPGDIGLGECWDLSSKLSEEVECFTNDLEEEYRKSFL